MPFGSLVPAFNPMQPPALQDTGLGAQGMKILQQAQQMARPQAGAQPGGVQPGGVQQPPMMGLLAKLFPNMMGQQPTPGQPLSLTPPAQPVMPNVAAPGSLSGLY